MRKRRSQGPSSSRVEFRSVGVEVAEEHIVALCVPRHVSETDHAEVTLGAPQSVTRPSWRRPLLVSAPPDAHREALVAPSLPARLRFWKSAPSRRHTR
eukprot:CAMPEP_0180211682 /NCGR_PEP_ID=MMETSP0987-20121128/12984_1 /TAXON_ID=697907 /ORGANISM="non described non described, Strain CCMP2293" /LENGTH=97 /DNA_ID=CAMNT_0022169073 /DNA_START=321 /DNA_END=612 /DNA_ORIENTATION=-